MLLVELRRVSSCNAHPVRLAWGDYLRVERAGVYGLNLALHRPEPGVIIRELVKVSEGDLCNAYVVIRGEDAVARIVGVLGLNFQPLAELIDIDDLPVYVQLVADPPGVFRGVLHFLASRGGGCTPYPTPGIFIR